MNVRLSIGLGAVGLAAMGLGAGAGYFGGSVGAQAVDNVRDGHRPVVNGAVAAPLAGLLTFTGAALGLTGGSIVGLAAGDSRIGNLVAAGLGVGGAITGAVLGARAVNVDD